MGGAMHACRACRMPVDNGIKLATLFRINHRHNITMARSPRLCESPFLEQIYLAGHCDKMAKPQRKSYRKNSNLPKSNSKTADTKSILVATIVALASVGVYRIRAARKDPTTQFVDWFHNNGGWMSTKIKLASFPVYGYGLLAQQNVSIARDELLLRVPESIQFSQESARTRFRQLQPILDTTIYDSLGKLFQDPLERQDAIIAVLFMVECSLGKSSRFYPYLAILPQSVSRLDTFGDEQLKLLQDASLEMLAKQSQRRLSSSYKSIHEIVWDLSKLAAERAETTADASCVSFESYHRYVAIVSSHAMILDETKYVVPMADMINHESHPHDGNDKGGESSSFASFHKRDSVSGDIHVHADRFINANDQVFEEYGKLDNSLYLVAHGFVPSNPHHCAILSASTLPTTSNPVLQQVLKQMNFAKELMHNVCVQRDGSVVGDPEGVVSKYIAVSSLEHGNAEQLELCIQTLHTEDQEAIRSSCVEYPKSKANIVHAICKSAAATLLQAKTTLEEDLVLLRESEGRNDPVSTLLALRFRIADKQLLDAIACYD